MVNLNPNVTSAIQKNLNQQQDKTNKVVGEQSDFSKTIKAVENHISKVNSLQEQADVSMQDLLTGKSEDINSVVASVAKADMSFKLLVGVRNKLIEAYKQTMNMPV